jgi:hypothetical protein
MTTIMKTFAIALALIILMPSFSWACSDHKRKPVRCSSYTNINGVTRSVCR